MKDNLKDFREASDLILKNVYVTDELKRKTLDKCINRKSTVLKTKLTASFSAALVVSLGIFFYFSHKPDINNMQMAKSTKQDIVNSYEKESEVKEVAKADGEIDSEKPSYGISNSSEATKNIVPEQHRDMDIAMKHEKNIQENKNKDSVSGENKEIKSQSNSIAEANENIGNDSQSNGVYVTNEDKEADSQNKSTVAVIENSTDSQGKSIAGKGDNTENDSQNKGIYALNDNNTKTAVQITNDSSVKASDIAQQNKGDVSKSNNGESNLSEQIRTSLVALVPKRLTVAKAEVFFESKILLPTYIPEGFMLADISIPDQTKKCVKLKYSSASADFEILQNKRIDKLVGTKTIFIGNSTAYVNSVKDEKNNVIATVITWKMNEIQYTITSSLPEDILIKIANSINN